MGKMIVLISSKGGSGKSTVAIGLASAFSSEGKKVLLIDADEGARCLDSMLKADTDTLFDLRDVLSGTCELQDAVLWVAGLDGVSVIPSPLSPEPINMAALGELAELQKNNYDYVIIDLKGQLPAERLVLLPKTAQFISVVTTDKIALRNTGLLNTKLIENGIVPRLILNRFKEKNHYPLKNYGKTVFGFSGISGSSVPKKYWSNTALATGPVEMFFSPCSTTIEIAISGSS